MIRNRTDPGLAFAAAAVATLMPQPLLQLAIDRVVACIHHRRPSVAERMAHEGDRDILIEPVDLPFRFLLRFRRGGPSLTLHRDGAAVASHASVRGPLVALLQLLEGKLDGDALFFSRVISFEGDTEAILALRNAIENGGIELVRDLTDLLGPLPAPARAVAARLSVVLGRAARDMEKLRLAVLGPLELALGRHAQAIEALQQDVASLKQNHASRAKLARRSMGEHDQ